MSVPPATAALNGIAIEQTNIQNASTGDATGANAHSGDASNSNSNNVTINVAG